MKITTVSILEISKAPSRSEFHKGLELGDGTQSDTSWRLPAEEMVPASDDQEQADAHHDDVRHLVAVFLPEATRDQVSDYETCTKHCEIHDFSP